MTTVTLGLPAIRDSRHRSTPARPAVPDLLDQYGRIARDLRVSLTEKCTLRCTYCMPADGLPPIEPANLLTGREVIRLVSIAVDRLGITEVRFTGGDPLVRRDLEEIIAGCRTRYDTLPLSITTNGIGLDKRAQGLAGAGLTRVNISLDTVDRVLFANLTRRDRLPAVLAGIRAAQAAGLAPVKINAVLTGQTLTTAVELLRWCIEEDVDLRFIEQMPLDAEGAWKRDETPSVDTLFALLGKSFRLTPAGRTDPSAPAEYWHLDGGPQRVGVIASVTDEFCGACDRTRITAEGSVRSCLFNDEESDLRGALRAGADDEEIANIWRTAMWAKPAGHQIDSDYFTPPVKSMGAIGG
ncbi:GTP 3',8-cyclase MoaA [Rhodococcus sp. IEGM 1307]|uniref:GTP 3',8-cyclase MoaA n=1 Tax=Rhodococcus sp. IEGM 1307 TaxID=3047091 RepID=UPI0024B7FBF0|nr:GTP 3',8-cyclase MoaA [Rhodococcus sp. IEGM 1307]MDI9978860.1 GTP 3',8-cyclase MoaA [Rhodococcus sp. IEGM 1307]